MVVGPSLSTPSQCLQAYLGRMCLTTWIFAGMMSSCFEVSSPIRSLRHPHSHTFSASSRSWTTSITGKYSKNNYIQDAKLKKHFKIAAVLPCYKSKDQVLRVIDRIGPEVSYILVVDDACPNHTGNHVVTTGRDPRVTVLFHTENQGVGGAVVTGYREALALGADIVVKIDSDGQMDPTLVPLLTAPIEQGLADYTKGNRFFNIEDARVMPRIRWFGNAFLSFLTKLSSGYWNIFDPTNGFTAVHRQALLTLPLEKISKCYFFETDMLFRLNIARAVVVDIPMKAVYGDEESNLKILRILFKFLGSHMKLFMKRIFYMYFLRDFSVASINLVLGLTSLTFGIVFGTLHWFSSIVHSEVASAGTVMLSALPIIVGVQMLLSFLSYDFQIMPSTPLIKVTHYRSLNTRGISNPGKIDER